MRKAIYRFLLLLGLIVLFDQAIGWILDKKYEANTCFTSNGEINDYLKNKNYDTLFIGSSRVLHMIDPSRLGPNCYNLAKQRKHNYYHTAIIDILSKANKLPTKLLVLNLEVDDIYMEKKPFLIDQVSSLSYYYSKNELVTHFINQKGFLERLKFMSRIYRHNPNGLKLVTDKIEGVCNEYPERGYIPLLPSKLDNERLAQSLIDDFKPIKNQGINQTVFENIRIIKALCDKKGIDLVIIDAPYYKIPPGHHKASSRIQKFCTKEGIRFIDFNDEFIPGLHHKSNWYDNMHTNAKGSLIYTNYLKGRLKLG